MTARQSQSARTVTTTADQVVSVKFSMLDDTATDETEYRVCGVGKEVGHHFGAVSPLSSWTGSWCRTAYCVHVLAGQRSAPEHAL